MRTLLYMKTGQRNKGFSLVELIVAIAIMAILTGIAAMSYSNLSGAKVTKCAKELYSAIESTRVNTMGKDEVVLSFRRDSDGSYSIETITNPDTDNTVVTETIGQKSVSVKYTYYGSSVENDLESGEAIEIKFDRASGAQKVDSSGNYIKTIEVYGRGKDYTITFYKDTGNVKLE